MSKLLIAAKTLLTKLKYIIKRNSQFLTTESLNLITDIPRKVGEELNHTLRFFRIYKNKQFVTVHFSIRAISPLIFEVVS